MRDQLQKIEASIQKNVRHVCSGLVQDINKELQTLQEHASKLEEYENQRRAERPDCMLQEHTSKLEDYEDLQKQHQLTLETCDSLRKQNVRLQNQVKDLLAERSLPQPVETAHVTLRTEKESPLRNGSKSIPANVQKLVNDHPELQAAMASQSKDYKKLQKAHSIILVKLKEHQKVIESLRNQRSGSEAEAINDGARLAHLRSIIATTARSSESPTLSISVPASSAIRTTASSTTAKIVRASDSDGTRDSGNPLVIRSSLPDGSVEHIDAVDLASTRSSSTTTRTTTTNIVQSIADHQAPSSHPVTESEPEFISERPVKKRRTRGRSSNSLAGGLVKVEPGSTDDHVYNDRQASIDLDAVYTPIGPLERSRVAKEPRLPDETDTVNLDHTQRHSEPPPDSIHVSAGEIASANKSVSFTSHMLDNGHGNKDRPRKQFASPRHHRSAVRSCDTLQRPQIQPESSLDPNHYSAEEFVEQRDAIMKWNNRGRKLANSSAKQLQRKILRERNIEELSVNDFKLNPAMNRGFNQTMGGPSLQKSRHCAADCSNPECCASAFATAIRKAGIASIDEMPESGKNQVISRYLGFPVTKLGQLSSSAYQTLLCEAIGKQFAEKYGKQLQARSDSPPGYWRVDFPTTQDRITDEQKANKLEQAVVKQRRREALRDGGLWMFRDE